MTLGGRQGPNWKIHGVTLWCLSSCSPELNDLKRTFTFRTRKHESLPRRAYEDAEDLAWGVNQALWTVTEHLVNQCRPGQLQH